MNGSDRPELAPINWEPLACVLAEKAKHPTLVIDRGGVVRLATSATSEVLGWPRGELENRPFWQALAPPGQAEVIRVWIARALLGLLTHHDSELRAADGRRLQVAAEVTAVGEGAGRCLVVAIRNVREVSAPRWRAQGELTYEVELRRADFGHLVRRPEGEQGEFGETDGPCYQVVYGFPAPCVDCPLRRPEGDPWPRVVVRRKASSTVYHLIRAYRVNADVALVTVNLLPETSISALNEAKVRHLADRASLTDRERGILTCLLLGRTPEEIAQMLGIKVRTVKFHQQNLLGKLGADSRVDLIRLIF